MKFEFSPFTAVQIRDYKNAVKFYKDVLGMDLVEEKENETHFKTGNMNFFIENSEAGNVFFEFKVESVSDAEALLAANGCKVTHSYSEKSKLIADPYGMKFHIWEEGADFE